MLLAQILGVFIYFVLLRWVFTRATVGRRAILAETRLSQREMIAMILISPLMIFFYDDIPFVVSINCDSFRCGVMKMQ